MPLFLETNVRKFPPTGALLVPGISLAYLLVSYWLIGFRPEQLVLVGLFAGGYYASALTRRFMLGFSIFIVFWIIYDYMKAFPNYAYRPVDIGHLYNLEKSLFGISAGGRMLTPNEFWLTHHTALLDVLCGLFYLCWIPVPLAFAGYLFFQDRRLFFEFSLTFLLVNLLGFTIYYLHPAAPPWYVQRYGLGFQPLTLGSTAGLARFDQLLGVPVFAGIYAKNSNIFAALPSLHSAYPVIVLFYAVRHRAGLLSVAFAGVMLGIWFAAVYTSHHYVLDVLAGIAVALLGIGTFRRLLRQRPLRRLLAFLLAATAPKPPPDPSHRVFSPPAHRQSG
ncbi:phosphatase PAP2 family protein [uncultured Hymenobacter sp.]|uniref:phosphatase PAP2 family protein n=1 Tax=uncultured Hymenobacter sp. TaxID=170016 RepID=UPI0035CBA75A